MGLLLPGPGRWVQGQGGECQELGLSRGGAEESSGSWCQRGWEWGLIGRRGPSAGESQARGVRQPWGSPSSAEVLPSMSLTFHIRNIGMITAPNSWGYGWEIMQLMP